MHRLVFFVPLADGHGHMTWPPNRVGGNISLGGNCENGCCYWFSNNMELPDTVPESLPQGFRTVTNGGTPDVYAKSPWRAPGRAPIHGIGCGVAGGGPLRYHNGGQAPACVEQGFDGAEMPPSEVTAWKIGSEVHVAFSLAANHGGGYAYRLCKKSDGISEDCFQQGHLSFAGDTSYIINLQGDIMKEFPLTKVTTGTWPEGSEWAMDPIPGCKSCEDARAKCGGPLLPKATDEAGGGYTDPWNTQVNCFGECSGATISKATGACPEGTEFYEARAGFSGFSKDVPKWSIMDKVLIPADLDEGEYLLSWRWDCEESTQVWQNCADIRLTHDEVPVFQPKYVGMPEDSGASEPTHDGKKGSGDSGCNQPGCDVCSDSCDVCCEGCARYEKNGLNYCWNKEQMSKDGAKAGAKTEETKDGRYPGFDDSVCAGDQLPSSGAAKLKCGSGVECWQQADLLHSIANLNVGDKTVVWTSVIGGADVYDLGDWFFESHPGGNKHAQLEALKWHVDPLLLKNHGLKDKVSRLERAGGKLIATTANADGSKSVNKSDASPSLSSPAHVNAKLVMMIWVTAVWLAC